MDKLLIATFENRPDLDQAAAALRQIGLEEVDQFDFTGEGFSIETSPVEEGNHLRIQLDEGQVDQVASIVKKSGGRVIDKPAPPWTGSAADPPLKA